jgi:uncharacterized protein YndB with AHSA1/START domain
VTGAHVDSDRRFTFTADRETVWQALCAVEQYPTWWPWLRRLDAVGMVAGDRWRCTVQPPLPYSLRFTIAIDDVVAAELVTATLNGDLTGSARLELTDAGSGSEIRLTSDLAPTGRYVRGIATVAFPLARFGHDWVLRTGARQFAERAL